MYSSKEKIVPLIKIGIGHIADVLPQTLDWQEVKALAEAQGLSAVVLDGLEGLRTHYNLHANLSVDFPDKRFMTQWIGEVLQGFEHRYKLYMRAIAEMAGFYNSNGFKMMVLKGYTCSLDWPKPEHRPTGDIDIWLFNKWKEANSVLAREKGIQVDNRHEHHTVFYWKEFMVENHYDFIDVHHRKTSPQLEAVFKELGKDDSYSTELYGEKVYLPSPNLHALFLLRHSMEHFASTKMTLRQLLDWAFFVEKHGKDVDWTWLLKVLDEFGMTPAFNIFNAICVEDLGFDSILFPTIHYSPVLKDRVLNDILSPEFVSEVPRCLIPRVLFKYRRWRSNGWKNKLCFKDSMWSAFWSGVWGHLLKPKSI